jgi:hypothetical protein
VNHCLEARILAQGIQARIEANGDQLVGPFLQRLLQGGHAGDAIAQGAENLRPEIGRHVTLRREGIEFREQGARRVAADGLPGPGAKRAQ